MKRTLALLAALLTLATTHTIRAHDAFRSESIRVGDTLFVSGQGSTDPATGKQPESMAAATRQAMENAGRVLENAGFDFSDVVAVNVWLDDLGAYAEMNGVYRSFFDGDYPTRTTLGVSGFPDGSRFQVAMVAYSGGKYLRGPQASGLLLGERVWVEAAWRNGAPHHAFGRPMKVG